jgi:hypothetical protein
MKLLASVCAIALFASVALAFEFRRIAEHVEEVGTVLVCILEEARASYAFRPPFNWDVHYDDSSKTATLAPKKDPKNWITIRLAPSTNSPAAGVGTYVQSAFPGCQVKEQFAIFTSANEAQAADFMDPSAGPVPLKRRIALLKSPSGTFEFLLSSRADNFEAGEQAFSQLMASFEFRGPPGSSPAPKAAAAGGQ